MRCAGGEFLRVHKSLYGQRLALDYMAPASGADWTGFRVASWGPSLTLDHYNVVCCRGGGIPGPVQSSEAVCGPMSGGVS